MRENRLSGSEGGVTELNRPSLTQSASLDLISLPGGIIISTEG